MNALYRHHSSSSSSGQGQTRKVKHFSYNMDSKIGKGYSSVVYKGTNELTNSTVAIKAIDMKGVKDAASREMLDCQIQALTKLKHENVLRCHDVVRETSHCFIITEHCNEGDLSALLKKKRRLGEREVLKLTKDIVSGFIEIAECGFLHRDLKLANIFMSGGRAVIADFGFAKKHYGCFEREKYNVGSPLYMSPEALKKNIYTPKNDIWSIGIMVFELLHGETPWECRTEKELIDKMVRLPVKFSETLKLTPQTRQFIQKCLDVNEETRMSLADLKQWNQHNSYQAIQQGTMNMSIVPSSAPSPSPQENGSKGLREVTDRQSLNQNKPKPVARVNSTMPSDKSKQAMPKLTIDKNNNILIIEINTFRLLFKIFEKLRKYSPDEKELLNTIGNQVLRRVNQLWNFVNPQKENRENRDNQNKGDGGANDYKLIEVGQYLNQETNSSIRKYKAVVKEYHKKYNIEISSKPLGRQVASKELMREMLTNGGLVRPSLGADELLMVFWMVEFVNLRDPRKEFLEGVIEPKGQTLTMPYLNDRIKAF